MKKKTLSLILANKQVAEATGANCVAVSAEYDANGKPHYSYDVQANSNNTNWLVTGITKPEITSLYFAFLNIVNTITGVNTLKVKLADRAQCILDSCDTIITGDELSELCLNDAEYKSINKKLERAKARARRYEWELYPTRLVLKGNNLTAGSEVQLYLNRFHGLTVAGEYFYLQEETPITDTLFSNAYKWWYRYKLDEYGVKAGSIIKESTPELITDRDVIVIKSYVYATTPSSYIDYNNVYQHDVQELKIYAYRREVELNMIDPFYTIYDPNDALVADDCQTVRKHIEDHNFNPERDEIIYQNQPQFIYRKCFIPDGLIWTNSKTKDTQVFNFDIKDINEYVETVGCSFKVQVLKNMPKRKLVESSATDKNIVEVINKTITDYNIWCMRATHEPIIGAVDKFFINKSLKKSHSYIKDLYVIIGQRHTENDVLLVSDRIGLIEYAKSILGDIQTNTEDYFIDLSDPSDSKRVYFTRSYLQSCYNILEYSGNLYNAAETIAFDSFKSAIRGYLPFVEEYSTGDDFKVIYYEEDDRGAYLVDSNNDYLNKKGAE